MLDPRENLLDQTNSLLGFEQYRGRASTEMYVRLTGWEPSPYRTFLVRYLSQAGKRFTAMTAGSPVLVDTNVLVYATFSHFPGPPGRKRCTPLRLELKRPGTSCLPL